MSDKQRRKWQNHGTWSNLGGFTNSLVGLTMQNIFDLGPP